jgi:O-antigen/teichoic acid export membrane protein
MVDGPTRRSGIVTPETGSRWHERLDASGAVYGSLLAASVIIGQAPLRENVPAVELAVILLATGTVFWLVHVYSRSVKRYVADGRVTRDTLGETMREEIPILLAAIPPAAGALVASAVAGPYAAAWCAFIVALVGQLVWVVIATNEAGASRKVIVASVLVNLALGLVLVALKVFVGH